jgi:hypothetical protein
MRLRSFDGVPGVDRVTGTDGYAYGGMLSGTSRWLGFCPDDSASPSGLS